MKNRSLKRRVVTRARMREIAVLIAKLTEFLKQTNFDSAAFIRLMSESPELPKRLAEILGEILALSNSAGTSHFESTWGGDPIELVDAHCVKQAKNEEHALDIELEK